MLKVLQLERLGLSGINLELAPGRITAVVGRSGAGKTVLLRAIADLDPNKANVSLDNVAREAISGPEWRRRVGYLATDAGWWSERIGDHFDDASEATVLLERLGLGSDVMNWPVSRTSTGERQRLALVRLLVLKPAVLLLDEPTSALDADATRAVEQLLTEIVVDGTAALLVTHDVEQAKRLSSTRLRLEDGKLEKEST